MVTAVVATILSKRLAQTQVLIVLACAVWGMGWWKRTVIVHCNNLLGW